MKVYSWGTGRRFNAFPDYFREKYGARMQKVSVDAGFTCPNRDGSKGTGGCTFCNNKAFNPSYCEPSKPVLKQIEEGIEFHKRRYRKVSSYLAYFQAYTNTYASVQHLDEIYREALAHNDIMGIVIGTRPDCVDDEVLDLLQDLARDHIVLVEYGVESCYDRTLKRISRGHSYAEAVKAIQATAERGIDTSAHFIFGLPGETKDDMLNEASLISELPLNSVKFHQLQIIKGTPMEEEFRKNQSDFEIFTWDEYLDFIIKFIERFSPEIVIERFSGEAPPPFLTRMIWGKKRNDQIIGLVESRLAELDTWQGRLYNKRPEG